MSSASLDRWKTTRNQALDEIEATHRSLGGRGPGRRSARTQLNHAYLLLLSAQFQGYCRDLYLECVEHLAGRESMSAMRTIYRNALVDHLRLNSGNPNPGNIGADYHRLGLSIWDEARSLDFHTKSRQNRLMRLNVWRNAIAHQDFNPEVVGRDPLRLGDVRRWRRACDHLAVSFDEVMGRHLASITGSRPW